MVGPRCWFVAVALIGVLVGCRCVENMTVATVTTTPATPVTARTNPVTMRSSAVSAKTSAVTAKTSVVTAKTSTTTPKTSTTTPKTSTTTARTTPKTTRTGNAFDVQMVRYDVSGNDTGDRGAALKEIVAMDETFRRDDADIVVGAAADASKRSLENATVTTGQIDAVKPAADNVRNISAIMNNDTKIVNSVPANNITTITKTTTTATTTVTAIGISQVNVVRNDARVVSNLVPSKYCYCDLIHGSCDMNCCCDTECTNHDLKSFTSCTDHAESYGSIKPESILFDSSLFYVVVENVPSDYFYPERDAIESESQVAMSLRNRDVFTWLQGEKSSRLLTTPSPHQADSAYNSYDLTYKSRRWMYIGGTSSDNSSVIKTFGLVNRAFDSLCTVEQPVEYLTAKETNCQRFVPNLTDVCNNGSSLSFDHYFGDRGVFKVVQPIYSNSQKTEKFSLVAIRATAHHHCSSADGSPYDCRVPAPEHDDAHSSPQHFHPVYSGGACRRVVDAVEYRLRHNGTGGVRAADVHFHHRDVRDLGRPVFLAQTFSVRFAGMTAAAQEPYGRSGKPGYETGSPVLVAAAAAATNGRPRLPEPMGLPLPDGSGTCAVAGPESRPLRGRRRRPTVNFLEAADVRCRVRVRAVQTQRWSHTPRQWSKRADEPAAGTSADLCHGIQNETVAALGDYEATLVASLGDPDVARWIPMVVVKPPVLPPVRTADDSTTSCPAIVDGVHIRVLYAHVGTFDSPRATVLGVLVNYTATAVAVGTETAARVDKNAGSNGNGNSNGTAAASVDYFAVAEIPIRATVIFVDLTRPPIRTFAEPPTYEFRLPEDFYYPFWSSSSTSNTGSRPPTPQHSSAANSSRLKNANFFLSLFVFTAVHCSLSSAVLVSTVGKL